MVFKNIRIGKDLPNKPFTFTFVPANKLYKDKPGKLSPFQFFIYAQFVLQRISLDLFLNSSIDFYLLILDSKT